MDMFRLPVLVSRCNKDASNQNTKDAKKKHLDDAYVLWLPGGFLGKNASNKMEKKCFEQIKKILLVLNIKVTPQLFRIYVTYFMTNLALVNVHNHHNSFFFVQVCIIST